MGRIPGKAGKHMALTDVSIRNAKPGAKAIKMAVGGGMFLLAAQYRGEMSEEARRQWLELMASAHLEP